MRYKKITKVDCCYDYEGRRIPGIYNVWLGENTYYHVMKEKELNLARKIDFLLNQEVDSNDIKAIVEATKEWIEDERETWSY
ncbi:MAG: hypothetical protein M0R03_20690 [Novosphingobium sp.]|nr:hypothetical protein [Novosphingobium sp.]